MIPAWASSSFFYNEFLETNGIGGFASISLAGAVTRRYHAFLCAATRAPQERAILVSKIEEQLVVGDEIIELSANFWSGCVSPRGDQFLSDWSLDPLPRWVYRVPTHKGEVVLQKTLWMPFEQNTTVARYEILSGPACELRVRALVTGRDYHSTHHANADFNTQIQLGKNRVSLAPYAHLPQIVLNYQGEFREEATWYYGFEWPIEIERGLDAHEDAFCPGVFVAPLKKGRPIHFAASTKSVTLKAMKESHESETARRLDLAKNENWNEPENRLRRAADQFIVKREDGLHTVLAGYPWFTDWGRDTMIALPGLCLTTGRFSVAKSILRSFAQSMSQGMIPNRFPEAGENPDYNTVDATLWFIHAVSQYGQASDDYDFVREIYPKLAESIEWHLAGTRYGIVADDEDGMLRAGDAKSQLTWMDAKVGDVAFTPRNGKPVEIQALWFNALCEIATLARCFEDDATAGICTEWSRKVAANFERLFWNETEKCLYDCVDGDRRDGAIRPNQIFAISLPHRILSHEKEKLVVAAVERELLTTAGLRSLSPRDSRFRGVYEGDQWSRDSGYHQGTVWTWPIGGFLEAYLKTNEFSDESKAQVKLWLELLIAHLDEAGMGSISEIFDGRAPHFARGCPAQAWSVSEVLRLWKMANNSGAEENVSENHVARNSEPVSA